MPHTSKRKLGEILKAEGIVTEQQISTALSRQGGKGKKLGKLLVDMGMTTDEEIAIALCKQLGLKYECVREKRPSPEILRLLDVGFVTKNLIMPVEIIEDRLKIVVSDPLNSKAIDEVSSRTGLKTELSVCTEKELLECIEHTYMINQTIDRMLKTFQLKEDVSFVALPQDEEFDVQKISGVSGASPALRLLLFVFMDAFGKKANDIYFEDTGSDLRIRYRIEGDIYHITTMPSSLTEILIYNLKSISNLELQVKALPQTGRFEVLFSGKSIELEVCTIPTNQNERVKVRLRYKDKPAPSFAEIGTPDETVNALVKAAERRQGLMLFTGPRNSGKRSMMYALLNELRKNNKDADIVALEERIENRCHGVTQINTAGIDATIWDSIQKQGPDIVMVDEIRDAFTARAVLKAANSGCLVLSSIQATGPADALYRLFRLNIERWLITSNISCVASLRLLRKICPQCREAYIPDAGHLVLDGLKAPETYYRGAGCKSCIKSGYKGHVGITEVVRIEDGINADLTGMELEENIQEIVSNPVTGHMVSLAWDQVAAGVTTLEEAFEKVGPDQWRIPADKVKRPERTGRPVRRAPAIQKPEAVSGGVGNSPDRSEEIKTVAEAAPKTKIVLAVTNPRDQESIKQLLEKNDFSIWMCGDGDEVLNILYAEDPDLLIWDILLPHVDGLKAYKKVYDSQRKQVPVISLTNKPSVLSDIEKSVGVDEQVEKPVDDFVLLNRIKKVMSEQGPRGKWRVM